MFGWPRSGWSMWNIVRCPITCGYQPVMKLARLGVQTGFWQYAPEKLTASLATSPSSTGVATARFPMWPIASPRYWSGLNSRMCGLRDIVLSSMLGHERVALHVEAPLQIGRLAYADAGIALDGIILQRPKPRPQRRAPRRPRPLPQPGRSLRFRLVHGFRRRKHGERVPDSLLLVGSVGHAPLREQRQPVVHLARDPERPAELPRPGGEVARLARRVAASHVATRPGGAHGSHPSAAVRPLSLSATHGGTSRSGQRSSHMRRQPTSGSAARTSTAAPCPSGSQTTLKQSYSRR